NGDELRLSPKGVELGPVRHPLDQIRGASARVLSRGMSIDVPGAPLRLEFTDRKTREAAMEALAKLLGGRVVRAGKSPWARIDIQKT
ncbi:MAG TPA: hypothetical protein VEA41_06185, partial [Salinarimonas sp.]|nr:hypothetical protein [Salinarimonas sp.]